MHASSLMIVLKLYSEEMTSNNIINNNDNNMLTVQYPMQFQYPIKDLLEILATHVQHRLAQANGGSTNTTRVHAFHTTCIN